MGFFDTLLYPFKVAIAWLWIMFHDMFAALGMGHSAAWVWGIVGITVVVRIVVLPLTFKAVRSGRAMSALQPEMKKIQAKYKGRTDQVSRQQMNQETMALYKQYGANPLASCFPILIQFPVLIALYRVLADATPIAKGTFAGGSLGPLTRSIAQQIEASTFFGAPLSASFSTTTDSHVRMVAVILVALYVVMMFLTQAWLAMKNIADGNAQAARMIKIMGYTMPIMMAFLGISLQIGVLVYWMVTMLFSMLQQGLILYYLPTPHSAAHNAMLKRNRQRYSKFEDQQIATYQRTLAESGFSEQEISQASSKIVKARAKGDDEDGLGDDPRAEKLRRAVEARDEHNRVLREKRIKLELEAAPPKKKKSNKRSFMDKMMDAQKKQQERQAAAGAAGKRDHSAQPKNLTRAQRAAETAKARRRAKAKAKAAGGDAANLSPAQIEKRRQERKRQLRENRKKRK